MSIDPNAPVFPSHGTMGEVCHKGMTIRAEIAARAMQGMLSNSDNNRSPGVLAIWAMKYADALIAELNKESQP